MDKLGKYVSNHTCMIPKLNWKHNNHSHNKCIISKIWATYREQTSMNRKTYNQSQNTSR